MKFSIRNFIGPIFAALLITVIFIYLLFPFGDLGDLVSSQVSQATQGQVFVQFDDMNLSLIPTPTVDLMGVSVESPLFPALSASTLSVRPSLSGLISSLPYGQINASGFLGGELQVTVKSGTATETGETRHRLILSGESLQLAKVRETFALPIAFEGQLTLDTEAQAHLDFSEQPELDLNINIDKFLFPPSTVNTPFGPLALPDMRMSKIHLKGRLSAGKFIIEEGTLGNNADEIFGTIKGNWAITFQKGGPMTPVLGAYNLDVDFSTKKSFETKAALFLSFLDAYKSAANQGSRYRFRVSGRSMDAPPDITALQ